MNVLVIAEIGVNHDGNMERALQLIDAAADAGADVVKFQTFRAELLATPSARQAGYQVTAPGQNQLELLHSLELSDEDHRELLRRCASRGVEFLSTGFDEASVDFLLSIDIKRIKVPSGEITNLPFLRHIGGKGLPVLLSTGMANLGEIERAIDVLATSGTLREQITVLHCTTEYPAPLDEVNLKAMQSIRQALSVAVGYSDHTLGSEVAIVATALGAEVIEKHITLDRTLPGPDHAASMEPDDFAQMVKSIRAIDEAMGDGIKRPGKRESLNIPVVRKSLVASKPIEKGEVFSSENLTAKRPGTGVSPMMWDEFMGRIAQRSYVADELIEW
jgi:N,N'-diacetyllegionaminate synthase